MVESKSLLAAQCNRRVQDLVGQSPNSSTTRATPSRAYNEALDKTKTDKAEFTIALAVDKGQGPTELEGTYLVDSHVVHNFTTLKTVP